MNDAATELVRAALAAGAREAEVFSKRRRGRRVVLEPGPTPSAEPLLTVSSTEEEGTSLRVVDREGRRGFAWVGLPPGARAGAAILDAALASARHEPPYAGPARPPLGPGPRAIAGTGALRIEDPECLALPPERIATFLMEAAAGADAGSGAVAVDHLALSEAVTTIRLANSHGFQGSYAKSLVFLSLALVPAEPGAAAVVEERSACRLADLDARDCFREALLRAGPFRPAPSIDASARVSLVLTSRAAASFLAAVAPWTLSADTEIWKGSTVQIVDDATLAGRPGSAPFDGAGYETRRTVLVRGGAAVDRLSETGGNLARPSYRDLPRLEPAGLMIVPARDEVRSEREQQADASESVLLRAQVVEVVPGPSWTLRVRRGEILRDGVAAGPADGLVWEGPLPSLLRGVAPVGTDVEFHHCGAPLGTPQLRIEGLTPLRVEAPGRTALRI